MKKVLVSFLILIFVCASVLSANEKFLNLETEIKPGSNPPGPSDPGVDPGTNGNGLYYLIGLAAEGKNLEVGKAVADGDLKTIEYSSTKPYTDASFLISENEDTYELDIFLAIGINISETNKLDVTISSLKGWVREDETETSVPIYFKSSVLGQQESNTLYAISKATGDTANTEEIEVTAIGPANSDYIYLAKTTAFWDRSSDYLAGTYTAEIKVEISAGN